jgi:hypothetical protein
MTRNLKGLGLALVAVFALSGVVASAAQGEKAAVLTAESYPATIDGQQLVANVFEREGRKITCEVSTLSGTITASEGTNVTATPTYSNCHAIILGVKFPVTITMNGCDYLMHQTGELNGLGEHRFTETVDLACTSPNVAELHIYENAAKHTAGTSMCTIKIPPQTGLKTIELTNKGPLATQKGPPHVPETPKNYIEAHLNVAGLTSTNSPVDATCGLNGHNSTGTLKGSATLKGTTDPGGVAQGITISTVT